MAEEKEENLFAETEGLIISIEDETVATRNYRKHILKEAIPSDKCRLCHVANETIKYAIGGCT